jgi:hypothetical protein
MNTHYNVLQMREIFYLEFLRWFGRKIAAKQYALKGGANLRFFFNGVRYPEEMALDVCGIAGKRLAGSVMWILGSPSFHDELGTYGIRSVVPPDRGRAKQTETTQRFKVHLSTAAGEDLFAKLEFSRRGFRGETAVQPVHDEVMRGYAATSLIVPHYVLSAAIKQKIDALCKRTIVQARDVFDLYMLSPHYRRADVGVLRIGGAQLDKARDNVFEIGFDRFRDTVVAYLSHEDRRVYDKKAVWDKVRMKASGFIEKLRSRHEA